MIDLLHYLNNLLHKFLGKNYQEVLSTILLITSLTVIYSVGFYIIKNRKWGTDKKRRTSINLRNSLGIVFILTMLFLWSGEIKTMVLSVAAIFAAILISFKEIILCFLGSLLIASNKLFSLGEYIEIDGIKGKVIDKNFLYTKIILYEPFQTREMNIPNLSFINNKMINLSHYGKFQAYMLKLSVPNFSQVKIYSDEVERLVSQALMLHSKKYNDYFSDKKNNDIFFDVPKNYYHIEYDLSDNRNAVIKLHYLAHPLDQSEIENSILTNYTIKLQQEYDKKIQNKEIINDPNKNNAN